MQKRNIPTDRTQRIDAKMGSFVWLSCLLSESWSLKCQKCQKKLFSADGSKKSVIYWAKY